MVYFTGDSEMASKNNRYLATLANVLEYAFTTNAEDSEYFPVVLQNYAFTSFLNNRVPFDKSIMTLLPGDLVNGNAKLRTTIDPLKSFIFDELSQDKLDDYVHDGSVYNRQPYGLTVKNFEREAFINTRYQIVATFNHAPKFDPSLSTNVEPTNKNEFVAILESLDIPLYAFSYDLSYTQFVHSERVFSASGKQLVNHAIPSRNHV
jgi:hypothetical protein